MCSKQKCSLHKNKFSKCSVPSSHFQLWTSSLCMDRKKTFLTKRIVLELSSVLAFLLLVNRPRPFSCFVYYGAFQTSSVITTSPAHKKRNVSWLASIVLILFSKFALACTVQVCFLQVIYGVLNGQGGPGFPQSFVIEAMDLGWSWNRPLQCAP